MVEDQAKPYLGDTSTSVSTIVDAYMKGRVACGVRTTHGGVKQRYPALQHQRGSQQLSTKRRRQSRPPIQPRQQTSLLTHRQSRQRTVKVQQLRNIGRVGVCGCGMEEKKCVCVSVLFCLNFKKGRGGGKIQQKKRTQPTGGYNPTQIEGCIRVQQTHGLEYNPGSIPACKVQKVC